LPAVHAGVRLLVCCLLVLVAAIAGPGPAAAMKPIPVPADAARVEITTVGDMYEGRGDSLQVETAAGADGASGRMMVRAATPGTSPNWIVFALSNPTDKPVERWLTADRYTVIGSGAVWPDLDARRIEAVTPSVGFVPERIKSDRADIFRITLEPGQTITYVAELSSERFARIYLWKPLDYEIKVRERQLFNGIMLGLTGLLAIFLTAVFAANHKAIFPSAALVSWCVLCYLCVDFGFFHKLFNLRPEDNAVYRAAGEAGMASSLVIFLHTFLRLGLLHGIARMLIAVWMMAQLALIAVAVIDPRLAATFARISFLWIGGIGALFTLFFAVRGQDRALSLIPTWLLFIVWIFASAVVLTGRLSGDIVVSGLVAGLVLIVVLIGFTVTQFAFRSVEPMFGVSTSETQLRALAVDGAGSSVWEWNARRDEIKVSSLVEVALGLNVGELSTKVEEFAKHLHPADRERFRLMLWSIQERAGGKIRIDMRMRHADNTYRCFELEAASIPSNDRRAVRCVGLMRDVTDARRAHERLLHDAVNCSLTGLPLRTLLVDRLATTIARARTDKSLRPTIILIDLDKFKSVNASFGLVVGDSLLLTTARRLQRHLGQEDTVARVGGDQFAILLASSHNAQELASLAERIRRSLRSPIKIAGQDVVLTGSLGIAVWEDEKVAAADLLKEAEIAMYRAKRGGADRIELFRPEMRADRDERQQIEAELKKALDKDQVKLVFQPIISLATEELAGFEAVPRWEHPKLGSIDPTRIAAKAEDEGSALFVRLAASMLLAAANEAARWQKEMPRSEQQLFVSINLASRQFFRPELTQEIRHVLGRQLLPPGCLRLEVSESIVMENPEQASEVLDLLRGAGAALSLDDFGTGYSSLAYLQRFPFDTIKIDHALVQASGAGDDSGTAIVRTAVALAHELDKKVVAEGVETAEDVSFLRGLGCEYGQGFFYGDAMTDKDVVALLKSIRKSERKRQPSGIFKLSRKKKGSKLVRPVAPQPEAAAGGAVAEEQPQAAAAKRPSVLKQRPRSGAKPAGLVKAAAANGAAAVPPPPPPSVPPAPPAHAAAGAPPALAMPPPPHTDAVAAGANGHLREEPRQPAVPPAPPAPPAHAMPRQPETHWQPQEPPPYAPAPVAPWQNETMPPPAHATAPAPIPMPVQPMPVPASAEAAAPLPLSSILPPPVAGAPQGAAAKPPAADPAAAGLPPAIAESLARLAGRTGGRGASTAPPPAPPIRRESNG
jgi:diguanylate cyclase (GGDEF)-like protein